MKEQSVFRTFFRYTSLNVLGMMGLSCYILADTYFIAKGLGNNGLTALNLAIPVYNLMQGLGLMIGMGGATKFSITRSRIGEEKNNEIFTQALCFALFLSLLFVLTALLFAGPLASLLGANEEVFAMTKTYVRVLLLFSPLFFLNNLCLCFVRNDGNPHLSMAAMVTGSFSNIILDYVFIFPLHMGIFGAILATGMAPGISLIVLSAHFIRRKNSFRPGRIRLSLNMQREIAFLGNASLITELSSGVVIVVFNFIILGLAGNVGVAAYGVIANISLVITAIFTGIAQGIQPIVSQNYGLQRMGHVKTVLRYGLITAVLFAILIYAASFAAAPQIVALFNEENNLTMAAIAEAGIPLYFLAFAFAGINIIASVYFGSVNCPKQSFVISILRGLFVIVPVAFLLSRLLGMNGIWLSFPVTEALVCLLSIFFLRRNRKAGQLNAEYDIDGKG